MSKIKRKEIIGLNFISIVILLTLTSCMHPVDYKDDTSSKTLKDHLLVSREDIYRNPEKVNALLKEHNITNVRIETKEEFQKKLSNLPDKTEVLEVNN